MESKLGLNFDLVEKARTSADNLASDVQGFIDQHTTVTVERAVCRLLGIDGVNEMDVPLPNVVVDHMDQSFLANVNERAVQLRAGIAKLPHVKSISGIGLMVGIEFFGGIQAADVLAACREAGLLVLTAKTRLRLLPPLTLSEHDVDMALEILSDVLSKMEPTAPKEQA